LATFKLVVNPRTGQSEYVLLASTDYSSIKFSTISWSKSVVIPMQHPYPIWKRAPSITPPETPTGFAFEVLLKSPGTGYGQGPGYDVYIEWLIYAYNGLYSGELDSYPYNQSEMANQVDVPYGAFNESSSINGNQEITYTIQTHQEDVDANTGYSEQCTQYILGTTDLAMYSVDEQPGPTYPIAGTYIAYRIYAVWFGGYTYTSMNFTDFSFTTTAANKDVYFYYGGIEGVDTPSEVVVERNINGAGWEFCETSYNGTFYDDGSQIWYAGQFQAYTYPVSWSPGAFMFGASGMNTLNYLVQKYDHLTSTYSYQVMSDLLGHGFIDDGSGWTAGPATFNTANEIAFRIRWNSVAGCTYRIRRNLQYDYVPIQDFMDAHVDQAGVTFTDTVPTNSAPWVAG
jgi:hypothetical protein